MAEEIIRQSGLEIARYLVENGKLDTPNQLDPERPSFRWRAGKTELLLLVQDDIGTWQLSLRYTGAASPTGREHVVPLAWSGPTVTDQLRGDEATRTFIEELIKRMTD